MDEDFDKAQYDAEALEHQTSVFEAKQLEADMTNCKAAWQLGRSLKTKLEDVESAITDGYTPSLNVQYKTIEEKMETFRDLISPEYTESHTEIISLRRELRKRWQDLNRV